MTGIDTNVLLRYLIQDDPVQSKRADEILENRLTKDEPGFVSLVTMAEVAWVLARTYKHGDQQIASAIEHLLEIETLSIQNEREVFTAMLALKTGRGSFADALIGALGVWAGCDKTLTFDRDATRLEYFQPA